MNLSSLLRRWRALIHKQELDNELDDEMRFHLERDIEENMKNGMTPDDARYAALKAFGAMDQSKEACRDARGVGPLENTLRDISYSLRVLLKSYAFTIVVVLTLALGIGANTAIFSFANGILLRPLPYPQSDRLAMLDETALKRGMDSMSVSYPNFLDWREQNTVFEDIGVHFGTSRFALSGAGEPVEIRGTRLTHGLFEILRVSPQLGRTFTADEDRPEQDAVVILGHDLWQRNFGGDPNIIGQKIVLSNRPRTVIGVMPRGFRFPEISELWVPLALTPQMFTRTDHGLNAIARLKDGVTFEGAQAEMKNIAARIEQQNPVTNEGLGVKVLSLHDNLVGDYREGLLILLGVVGFVLLVACVNVANLMLARATARQKEFALRAALGASRWRIMRQLLVESLVLAVAGGVLGFVLSLLALRLLLTAIPIQLPFWMNFGIDFRVLAFAVGITLLTGAIFGAIPALQTSRVDLNDTLKEGGRGSIGFRGRSRSLLVVTEIALSLVLLVGAGLMIQSFLRLRRVNIGLDAQNVLTARLILPSAKYRAEEQRATFFKQLLERVRGVPGVAAASATATLPLSGSSWGRSLTVEGYPVLSVGQAPMIQHSVVTPGYFRTMGIALLHGRDFTDADALEAPKVTIIDERLAREYWPNENPIGKRIRFGPPEDNEPWHTIIGVVSPVRHQRMQEETRKSVYLPHLQIPVTGMALVAKTTSPNPREVVNAIRREVAQIDPDQPLSEVATMEEVVAESIWQPRLYATLFSVFAGGALILALIGIYGVMAFLVQTRTHEIGVRMALGATARDVFKLIVGRGMKLTIIGVVIGVGGAIARTRLMQSLLFNTSTTDPLTFIAIALLLSVAAFFACYIPARRAAKLDPLVALRYE
ncbi:MAG TPA: ABC transporter permease [Pyrinomonadaceae bacterium]|nr:ABC transporter permease [Pyrinomonadaceae bacterium]